MQLGLLVLSAMLASHSVDEAKRYSSNACYELRDDTATPLKLVSVLVVCWGALCPSCDTVFFPLLLLLQEISAMWLPHHSALSLQLSPPPLAI